MISLNMPWWVVLLIPSKLWILIYFIVLAVATAVSAWIIGIHMRGRIKKDLGRAADDSDLTSIETWMKVDEVEEKTGASPNREWIPQYTDVDGDMVPEGEKPIDLFPKKDTSRWQ